MIPLLFTLCDSKHYFAQHKTINCSMGRKELTRAKYDTLNPGFPSDLFIYFLFILCVFCIMPPNLRCWCGRVGSISPLLQPPQDRWAMGKALPCSHSQGCLTHTSANRIDSLCCPGSAPLSAAAGEGLGQVPHLQVLRDEGKRELSLTRATTWQTRTWQTRGLWPVLQFSCPRGQLVHSHELLCCPGEV